MEVLKETSAKQRAADILSAEQARIPCNSSAGATPAALSQRPLKTSLATGGANVSLPNQNGRDTLLRVRSPRRRSSATLPNQNGRDTLPRVRSPRRRSSATLPSAPVGVEC